MTVYEVVLPCAGTSADIRLRLNIWEQSQDIPGNRTYVGYSAYLYKVGTAGYPNNAYGTSDAVCVINGTTVINNGSLSYDFRSPNNGNGATVSLGSGYLYVNHNSDGTKTISFSLSWDEQSANLIGDGSISNSQVLTLIPRAPQAPSFDSISSVLATSFVANFTPPSDVGGGPISGYTVRYSTTADFSGTVYTETGASSPILCDNGPPAPNTTYYAQVKATNAYGDSAWSNSRSFTTAAAGSPHIGVVPMWDGSGFLIACSLPFGVGSATNFTIKRTVTGPGAPVLATIVDTDGIYFDPYVLLEGQTVSYQAFCTVTGVDTGLSSSRAFAYQAVTHKAPFIPIFDGSYVPPSPFSESQSTVWGGTTNQSASDIRGTRPLGWRTFGAGSGSLVSGNVTQLDTDLALGSSTGLFDVMALFGSVQTNVQPVRVGAEVLAASMASVYPGVTYFGSIKAMVDVATRLACEIEWYTEDLSLISRTQGTATLMTAYVEEELQVSGTSPENAAYAAVVSVDVAGTGWAAGSLRFCGSMQLSASLRYPYFDGDSIPDSAYAYEWRGADNASASLRVALTSSGTSTLVDPDDDPIDPPPTAPVVDESSVLTDIVWRRYVIAIPASVVRKWIASVPTLSLRTAGNVEREVRVRYWRNPNDIDPELWTDTGLDFESEQIISYIPASSTFTIDGVAERAYVVLNSDLSSTQQAADHLLYGEGGGPATWPALDCATSYILTLDVPVDSTEGNITVFLDLTDRMM